MIGHWRLSRPGQPVRQRRMLHILRCRNRPTTGRPRRGTSGRFPEGTGFRPMASWENSILQDAVPADDDVRVRPSRGFATEPQLQSEEPAPLRRTAVLFVRSGCPGRAHAAEPAQPSGRRGGPHPDSFLHRTRGRKRRLSRAGLGGNAGRGDAGRHGRLCKRVPRPGPAA